jgi:hypothetical protein
MKNNFSHFTDNIAYATDEELAIITEKVNKKAMLDYKILKITRRLEKLNRELSDLKEERESFKY